jgi:hypothetical protein
MYITRLRGYSKHIVNKSYFFTTKVDPIQSKEWLHQNLDWSIEQPDGWADI